MARSISSRGVLLLLLLLVVAAAAFGGPQQQAPPARDQAPAPAPEPTGTGRLTVVVVASDTGALVKRVQVGIYGMLGTPPMPPGAWAQLSSSQGATTVAAGGGSVMAGPSGPGRVQKEGETDETGRVEFGSLPAGVYNVVVRSSPSGFVRPISSESIQLKDGEAGSQTIRLLRGGVISGRIVDETGDPLSRVSVRAIAKRGANGLPQGSSTGMTPITDDRGEFRIYGLAPGDYFVAASVFSASMGDGSSRRTEPRIGYLPTFYPGAPAVDAAQAVSVKSAQETSGIDFGMVRGRLGRVIGTALDSSGASLSSRGASVMLSPRNREMASSGRGAALRPDGTFVLDDVPPGEYYLVATIFNAPGLSGPSTGEGAFVPVTVTADEVVVDVRTNRGATLSGRVVREGPMPPPPAIPGGTPRMPPPQAMRVSVGMRPPATGSMTPAFNPGKFEYFDADATFRITGARGAAIISASSGVGVVRSIHQGAKDLLGVPLELLGNEQIDDIEIVLTTETGALTGTVTTAGGQLAAGAWVLVFPDDPKRWSQPFVTVTRTMTASAATASSPAPGAGATPSTTAGVAVPSITGGPGGDTRPRGPGQFMVPRLLPGRYLVATLGNPGDTYPSPDPELLASLRPKASTVTVVAGELASVQLKQ